MTFKDAVERAEPPLNEAYRSGLQALDRQHAGRVRKRSGRWTGSIAVDEALERAMPNDPRWDYGIGYVSVEELECAVWIEVHPASTGCVREVLAKLDWLIAYLREHAPDLLKMSAMADGRSQFVWITTGPVDIPDGSREARLLFEKGEPIS